jgi:hypothetical protein
VPHPGNPNELIWMYLVMTDAVAQQVCQPCPGGLSKDANEIIAVNVQQFLLFHLFSLLNSAQGELIIIGFPNNVVGLI